MAKDTAAKPPLPSWKNTVGLYLDLGKKNTGYAIMRGYTVLHYGEVSFQKYDSDGEMLFEWQDWLRNMTDTQGLDLIGVEYAAFQRGRANELWHGMMAVLKILGYELNLPIRRIYPGEIKNVTAGFHRASKKQVLAGVNARHDLDLTSHDIADAIGVGMAIGTVFGRASRGWIL